MLPRSRSGAQALGQIQGQIVVIDAGGVGLADLVAKPDAAAVGDVAPFHIHPLGAAVAAVQTHAQVDPVGVAGGEVEVVKGNKENIKLTTPVDVIIAESILKERAKG